MQKTPLTINRAAEYSGFSRQMIYGLVSRRVIPSYKTSEGRSGKVIIAKEDLDEYLFGHRRDSESELQKSAERLVAAN